MKKFTVEGKECSFVLSVMGDGAKLLHAFYPKDNGEYEEYPEWWEGPIADQAEAAFRDMDQDQAEARIALARAQHRPEIDDAERAALLARTKKR